MAFRNFVYSVVLLSSLAVAKPTGTLTAYANQWDGTRYYYVYVPKVLAIRPALIGFLNATSLSPAIPFYGANAWELLADQYGFIMFWPISSWSGTNWHWECDGCAFSVDPDDMSYLRWLITGLQTQYNIGRSATTVAGMSSGGYEAHYAGTVLSDLVSMIAPVSGMKYVEPVGSIYLAILPSFPVSVYELHGDADAEIPYCGGPGYYWSRVKLDTPSVEWNVNSYWAAIQGCTPSIQALCTGMLPTAGVNGQVSTGCNGGAEVIFEREPGVGHKWVSGTELKIVNFVLAHQQ